MRMSNWAHMGQGRGGLVAQFTTCAWVEFQAHPFAYREIRWAVMWPLGSRRLEFGRAPRGQSGAPLICDMSASARSVVTPLSRGDMHRGSTALVPSAPRAGRKTARSSSTKDTSPTAPEQPPKIIPAVSCTVQPNAPVVLWTCPPRSRCHRPRRAGPARARTPALDSRDVERMFAVGTFHPCYVCPSQRGGHVQRIPTM